MAEFEGMLTAEGMKIGIVASRFNEFITSKLLSGAMDCLRRHGADEEKIDVAWVPGAFEMPLIASKSRYKGEHKSLRLCVQRSIKGNCFGFPFKRRSRDVRRFDH